jgi:UDP-N-acetylglucosamine--dolichyl-phosphate N-acetylglucosaminephosphotransferase
MELILFSCFAMSFLVTLFITPKWMKKARTMGLVGHDMNKRGKPEVPEAGGVSVIMGAVIGILIYILLKTFYFGHPTGLIEIFAFMSTILMAGFIGFIDDVLGWKVGMSQKTKVLSTLPIAIPLAVVNAGTSTMILPLIGVVDFGLLFPLIIIPVGIIGATNGFNMLAGYNGLETGMGIILLSALAVVTWFSGSSWVTMIALSLVFSLLAFLVFNRFPAKVFPGDSMTYAVGASIACIAILGNVEKMAVLIFFVPYILFEAFGYMKFIIDKKRGVVEKMPEAFATKVYADGSLEFNERVYGFEPIGYKITRLFKRKVYERDVVVSIWGVQILIVVIMLYFWFRTEGFFLSLLG